MSEGIVTSVCNGHGAEPVQFDYQDVFDGCDETRSMNYDVRADVSSAGPGARGLALSVGCLLAYGAPKHGV